MTKQWQAWNAQGRCGSCGGSMPGDPKHTDIRCPKCVAAGKKLAK